MANMGSYYNSCAARFQFDHIQSVFVGSAVDRRLTFTVNSKVWGTL